MRLLCADTHPDPDTICTFRRAHRELLARSFAQVIELSARCGVLRVGGITVALDGTKVLASASRHAAVSDGAASGVRVLAAAGRERHGRSVRDLEKKAAPPEPPPDAPWSERMAWRVRTAAGGARYKLRQQTVEPVFGIIKSALGFRGFRLRGKAGAALEWTLVTLAYNLRRLHRLGAQLKAA